MSTAYLQNNLSLVVSILSLFIASLSLSWNIYNEITKRRGKIRVTLQPLIHGRVKKGELDIQDIPVKILGEAINIGHSDRVIKNYVFRSMIKNYNTNYISGSNGVISKTLKPGEIFSIDLSLDHFITHFNNRHMFINKLDRIRLEIHDTHGKKYKSNSVPLELFYHLINLPKEQIEAMNNRQEKSND